MKKTFKVNVFLSKTTPYDEIILFFLPKKSPKCRKGNLSSALFCYAFEFIHSDELIYYGIDRESGLSMYLKF